MFSRNNKKTFNSFSKSLNKNLKCKCFLKLFIRTLTKSLKINDFPINKTEKALFQTLIGKAFQKSMEKAIENNKE